MEMTNLTNTDTYTRCYGVMHLYLKVEGTLEETADIVAAVALPGHERQLRDGLNLGGGEYFKFISAESEILLVHNDTDHLEVFVEERASFPFYCYARNGGADTLDAMVLPLRAAGVICELGSDLA